MTTEDGKPPLRILCAEDNVPVGDVLRRLLTTAGHAVEHVTDGLAAWEKMSEDLGQFNLLITDNQMPRLSGLELVEILRQAGYAGRIVVYSGALTAAEMAGYRAFGVDAIVAKATPVQELLKAVEAFSGA